MNCIRNNHVYSFYNSAQGAFVYMHALPSDFPIAVVMITFGVFYIRPPDFKKDDAQMFIIET